MKVVFLDRDGVINQEISYLHRIENFIFIDGVFSACKHFLSRNYHIIIITNQSGIARGYYKRADFYKVNDWMLKQFGRNDITILDTFFCPHKDSDNCTCRKPKPGMLLAAQKKHNINMTKSWIIGDKEDDITAANQAKISNTILVKSGHSISEKSSKAKFILKSIKQSINTIQ